MAQGLERLTKAKRGNRIHNLDLYNDKDIYSVPWDGRVRDQRVTQMPIPVRHQESVAQGNTLVDQDFFKRRYNQAWITNVLEREHHLLDITKTRPQSFPVRFDFLEPNE